MLRTTAKLLGLFILVIAGSSGIIAYHNHFAAERKVEQLQEEKKELLEEKKELLEENDQLRESADTFGELAERLNHVLGEERQSGESPPRQ